MSMILPVAGDPLNSPSHSRLHRVIAVDSATPEQSVTVDANGYLYANKNNNYFGDGTGTGDKVFFANTAAVNKPNLKFNVTTSKWQFSNDGTTWTDMGSGGGSLSYTTTFTDASLSSTNQLAVAHTLGVKMVIVAVYDNNDKQIIPDEVTLSNTNLLYVDLTSFRTLTGTWNVKVVG